VVEVSSLDDIFGSTCARRSTSRRSDCGTVLCSAHAQRYASCNTTICPSCLSFHQAERAKPAAAQRSAREKERLIQAVVGEYIKGAPQRTK